MRRLNANRLESVGVEENEGAGALDGNAGFGEYYFDGVGFGAGVEDDSFRGQVQQGVGLLGEDGGVHVDGDGVYGDGDFIE